MTASTLGIIVGTVLMLTACENNDRAQMGGPQRTVTPAYRGAVPADFVNTADGPAFEAQSAAAVAKASPVLEQFEAASETAGFSLTLVPEGADGNDSAQLPDVNRCAGVSSLLGPTLEREYVEAQFGLIDGSSDCSAIFAGLGIGFPGVISALRGQMAEMTQFGIGLDDCTDVTRRNEADAKGAVRIALSPRTPEPGAYLGAFALPQFTAGVMGGAADGSVALQGEMEMRARGTTLASGAATERYQWVGIGSFLAASGQTISSERREIWEGRVHGTTKVIERMQRATTVTLGLGPTPELTEQSAFETTSGSGAKRTRATTVKAIPAGDGGLSLDVTTKVADEARHYSVTLVRQAGAAPACQVGLVP